MQNSFGKIKFSFVKEHFHKRKIIFAFLYDTHKWMEKKSSKIIQNEKLFNRSRYNVSSQHDDAYNTTLAAGLNSKILSRFDLTTGIYVP